ncbi:MAG: DUF1702 family protein [Phycisphaerae bacterium]|nr:DUF1702 family protein [Phycisphaerae bacterium]
MGSMMGTLRTRLFGISRRETTFARRGFPPCPDDNRRHLERIGQAFVEGYQAALTWDVTPALIETLNDMPTEFVGFGFEGAAMAFALLDRVTPWRRDRIANFLEGPGERHTYMIHVGVGFALARLRRRVESTMSNLDPLLRWLVVDGYGFHEGFFRWRETFEARTVPGRIAGYARRVFDQGLGRALWFCGGAQADRIGMMIAAFPQSRRPDLWSGIGLASAYAGGVGRTTLEQLRGMAASDNSVAELKQGAAFAAKARERAGIMLQHTEMACEVYCDHSATHAARLTDEALAGLDTSQEQQGATATTPTYEVWRRRIQAV